MKYKLKQNFADLPKGSIVFEYGGCTYGCISSNGIAVTLKPDKTPFFEVPKTLLDEVE